MASAPQQSQLPLFYNALEPLSSEAHANFKIRGQDSAPFLVNQHAIPITVDEFTLVQRHMPIVFTVGDNPVPLALMGLNEGVNVFVGDDGRLTDENVYIPAYIRRYPYMLAKLHPAAEDLSLCFDPTSGALGAFDDGEPMFVDGKPTEIVNNILNFSQSFEEAGARTANFMADLKEMDLLHDGEITIQADGAAQPFVYRGFMMINEDKLKELRGDQLRKIHRNGMLPLLYAHQFSLLLMREIFAKQMLLGKVPVQEPMPQSFV